ncbi:Chromate resistance protein ChrB [Nostoc sp.]|uniref:Chromate resistance protein ChrB n=1 Tax=Nostoc sp. TaxID=1180 RepID=UPI002FF63C7B
MLWVNIFSLLRYRICLCRKAFKFSQVDQKYQEFLGQCRNFHSELSAERKRSNFTFAELEENDAELTQLRSWLPKICDRNLFDAQKYSLMVQVWHL